MLAFQVLAARDEDQCFFDCFIVRPRSGRPQRFDQKLRIRQVGSFVFSIARPAVTGIRFIRFLVAAPLFALEEPLGVAD